MQHFLMSIPEMQRFAFRLRRFLPVNLRVLPTVSRAMGLLLHHKKPHRPPPCRGKRAVVLDPHEVGARRAPPPGFPSLTKYGVGVMIGIPQTFLRSAETLLEPLPSLLST